jgi:putative proteasome-type protease
MTFCLGMKLDEGLVGIADTCVTSGSEHIVAKKVTIYQQDHYAMFLMTSGLRSIRDKTLTYFDELMEDREEPFDRLFKAVNALADKLRIVAKEDEEILIKSGFTFNFYALIGGQCVHDKEHKLYLLYPQGNWVEIGGSAPYAIIGETGYGKPVLDRTLKSHDTLKHALKVGCLAFDSTRISTSNVNFPIDVVLYPANSFGFVEHRFDKKDLETTSGWWQERLRNSVENLPGEWSEVLFSKLSRSESRKKSASAKKWKR